MNHASFMITKTGANFVLIKDMGPWSGRPTITNDAEWVVEHLQAKGALSIHQRLFYLDSEGQEAELVFGPDGFIRFEPGSHAEVPSGEAD